MFPHLPQDTQDELTRLTERYGQPVVRIADLNSTNQFDPLNKSDRYGEVCMVIRRPNGHLLTMKKTFYPPDAYRLPTGGIHHGERIFSALLREIQEETGLQTEAKRFLALAAYRTTNTDDIPAFYTFAFLLDEIGGTLGALDEEEQVEAFHEITPAELPALAAYLQQLGTQYSEILHGDWGDWGQFRAVIHQLVWEALQQ